VCSISFLGGRQDPFSLTRKGHSPHSDEAGAPMRTAANVDGTGISEHQLGASPRVRCPIEKSVFSTALAHQEASFSEIGHGGLGVYQIGSGRWGAVFGSAWGV